MGGLCPEDTTCEVKLNEVWSIEIKVGSLWQRFHQKAISKGYISNVTSEGFWIPRNPQSTTITYHPPVFWFYPSKNTYQMFLKVVQLELKAVHAQLALLVLFLFLTLIFSQALLIISHFMQWESTIIQSLLFWTEFLSLFLRFSISTDISSEMHLSDPIRYFQLSLPVLLHNY